MQTRIYLDNNATTDIDPAVFEQFVDSLKQYGNPSSPHFHGRAARGMLIKARAQVASFFGVKPKEVVFTSSGTEANNLVLRGFFGPQPKGHIITSDVEHSSVYNTIKSLEKAGCTVTYLQAGLEGAPSAEAVEKAIRPDTKLISLIGANNETGVKVDIEAIALMAEKASIPFMLDAVCLIGKDSFTKIPKGVTFLTCSGHKFHAPKGVAVAIIRESAKLYPYITGGPQEGGLRAGTENVAAIVSFAKALSVVAETLKSSVETMRRLRDHFEASLFAKLRDVEINGYGQRVCNTSNLRFSGIDGEALLIKLDLLGVSVSHGSACASSALEPSRVLLYGVNKS